MLRFHWEIKFSNEIPFAYTIPKEKCPQFPSPQFFFLLILSWRGAAQIHGYHLGFFFCRFSLYYLVLKWWIPPHLQNKIHQTSDFSQVLVFSSSPGGSAGQGNTSKVGEETGLAESLATSLRYAYTFCYFLPYIFLTNHRILKEP